MGLQMEMLFNLDITKQAEEVIFSRKNHIEEKIAKANKGIGLIHKLAHALLRLPLITIYKSFIWPHLNYGDINYD